MLKKNFHPGFNLVCVCVCACVLNRCFHYQACPQISQQSTLLSKCGRCVFTGHPERSHSLMANTTGIQTHTDRHAVLTCIYVQRIFPRM